MVLDNRPLCLRATLEASLELVAGDALRKGLEVAYTLDPRLAARPVLGDSIRIRQVGVCITSVVAVGSVYSTLAGWWQAVCLDWT